MNGFSDNVALKGKWNFCVTEGAPINKEEWGKVFRGEDIGRSYENLKRENVVTLVFRSELAQLLARIPSADASLFRITHQQLGTGSAAASENDIDLDNGEPTTYTLLSDVVANGKQIQVTGYFAEGEATGHWKEYGLWLNGDQAEPVLFNRLNVDRNIGGASSLSIFGTVDFNI